MAGRSIADVLELTVAEAVALFALEPDVVARLQPLVEVGLEYLRLGQPVPTLSGGEAQRLKLAGHLADAATQVRGAKGSLFLFDEPTTGLHFDDVAKLLKAFRRLIDAGHSLVVIEHNLDVIRASDWILDLGPEGGDAGGEIVCIGTPSGVMAHDRSHTGRSLREYEAALESAVRTRPASARTRARQPAPGRPAPARPQRDHDPQRPRAQPQEHRRRHPARPLHRRHRRVRLGQVDARVRHRLRRGTASLPRVAQRLRAPVRAAGDAPGRGRPVRRAADGRHRAAHEPGRAQVHRRDAHRGLPLPAAALHEARHAVLPRLQRRRSSRRAPTRSWRGCSATIGADASASSRRWS